MNAAWSLLHQTQAFVLSGKKKKRKGEHSRGRRVPRSEGLQRDQHHILEWRTTRCVCICICMHRLTGSTLFCAVFRVREGHWTLQRRIYCAVGRTLLLVLLEWKRHAAGTELDGFHGYASASASASARGEKTCSRRRSPNRTDWYCTVLYAAGTVQASDLDWADWADRPTASTQDIEHCTWPRRQLVLTAEKTKGKRKRKRKRGGGGLLLLGVWCWFLFVFLWVDLPNNRHQVAHIQ
ncbi:hypothetical protein BCV70DRAFT_22513 [Testicularia cyperi]|uniref:Uncharacterized protein n=1 Tax=Testicularia cyperi TaxID=1882483 RepID=A0A317XZL2_9BASI|nr:hypothetical protein BCV70DRAFT_22513 [Testicularia cyperi]